MTDLPAVFGESYLAIPCYIKCDTKRSRHPINEVSKKVEVAACSQVRDTPKKSLFRDDFGCSELDFLADRMDAKARTETGWHQSEALRSAQAVRAFQESIQEIHDIGCAKELVCQHSRSETQRVPMDAMITQESKGITNSSGLGLKYAFGADRSSWAKELSNTAGSLFWALEGGQMETLARLCLAVEFAGQNFVKVRTSHACFRRDVMVSCREIAARWDEIEPPHDCDGPEWNSAITLLDEFTP